ncbi:triose-phosphate transporter family-domain-containing protein [Zychaea mexicana]|uniref:triose-phosphate transporter family-domain-containing protein n=1 Tax=Zychaea mexicana TaxID=64656 RepID=UPI0022FDE4F6|nr:triose-phosphate transporter family-domain-containing protein [Zychaea mexicana]KAI9493303.1 triose-phosphate transporter family-domain-containing protein [Zychaea mexicana]
MPQSLPTPPLPSSDDYQYQSQLHSSSSPEDYGKGYLPSVFAGQDAQADLSTRHIDSTSSSSLQNLWNFMMPRARFGLSDNLKFILNCCMWYISSSLTNNTGKQILNMFKFPVTLTFIQFGLVAMWCYVAAMGFGVTQIRSPTRRIAETMAPLAVFLIVGHVFSSIAISRVPVSLVHTIKKLIFKEANLGKGDPNKLDKMNMLFYSSLLSFILMSPLWLYSDGASLMADRETEVGASQLCVYFLLNGSTNFAQNWFAFTTLSMTSPVTYSIASLVKRIFVIVMSILWFGQQVSFAQSLGIMLTFVGLWMYQSAKRDVDRGETKVREKSVDVLPTSSGSSGSFDNNGTTSSIQSWMSSRWNGTWAARGGKNQ